MNFADCFAALIPKLDMLSPSLLSSLYNEKVEENRKPKFYQTTWALIAGFCVVGPFVLPLVWKNPYYTQRAKWIFTVVFTAITLASIWVMYLYLGALMENYNEAMQEMKAMMEMQ